MDPLSVTASVIAVLQAATAVVSICYNYQCAVEGVRWGLPNLLEEVRDLRNLLEMVAQLAQKAESGDKSADKSLPSLKMLSEPHGPLDIGLCRLEALEKRLTSLTGSLPFRSKRKALLQVLTWPLKETETKRVINEIERLKVTLNLAISADHTALALEIRNMVLDMHNNTLDIQEDIQDICLLSKATNQDMRHERIHRWLSPSDPSQNHNAAKKKKQAETGTWFIKSNEFYNWRTNPGGVLWLHGIPGCGKTVLSSTVIDQLFHVCQARPQSVVAYFYFDFNDSDKQSSEKMLRSLVDQLLIGNEDRFGAVEALFSAKMERNEQPTSRDLLIIFQKSILESEQTYIIIDALDECETLPDLLDNLEEILQWGLENLHLMLTSRKEQDIEDFMEGLDRCQKVSVQSSVVNSDIGLYVQERLRTDRKLKRWWKWPEVQKEIAEALMSRADGMFRLAACQLDSLVTALNTSMLRKALISLPKTLDDTYSQALCRIDEEHAEMTFKIFQWLICSTRPLYIDELAEVVTIDGQSDKHFDPERRFPEPRDILRLCPSLLVSTIGESYLDNNNHFHNSSKAQQVKLAHFSVKEYLLSERIRSSPASRYAVTETHANASIAEDCLTYVLQFDRPYFTIPSIIESSHLRRYAANHWPNHISKACKESDKANKLAMELFESDIPYRNWVLFTEGYDSFRSNYCQIPTPLYYASSFGLFQIARHYIGKGEKLNVQCGPGGSALDMAVLSGHVDIVQLLLETGANPQVTEGLYGPPLHVASNRGYTQIVKLLLEKGADIKCTNIDCIDAPLYGTTALEEAAREGHEDIVRLLLDRHEDIKDAGDIYEAALEAAQRRGNTGVVSLLERKISQGK